MAGRWYYALGVTSLNDPIQRYTVLLDPMSGLPHALCFQDEVNYFDDYVTNPTGAVIPSLWTIQTMTTIFEVQHVREAAP